MDLPRLSNSQEDDAWRRRKLAALSSNDQAMFAAYMLTNPASEWQDAMLLTLALRAQPAAPKPVALDPRLSADERKVLSIYEPPRKRKDSPLLLDTLDDLLVLSSAKSKFHKHAGGSTLKARTIKHIRNGVISKLVAALPTLDGLSRQRRKQLQQLLGDYQRRFA